jgi:predicted alpha-1,2-mannosidase
VKAVKLFFAGILVCILSLLTFPKAGYSQEPGMSRYVDPNIGTAHSRWFFYTPAAHPFGMAKPAPSTNGHYGNRWGWEAVGYDSRHESIEAFVNFHEFQIGGIALMATTGDLLTTPGLLEDPDSGYRSRFSKESEIAGPGYYRVLLDDYGVEAELTSTPRVAYHRYTFPETTEANLLFDIGNRQGESGAVSDAYVQKVTETEAEGYVVTLPEYVKNYQPGGVVALYFVAEWDKPAVDFGSFNGEIVRPGQNVAQGQGAGVYLRFNTDKQESITVKVGLSYTSIENARRNLEAEASDLSFDDALSKARNEWENMLGRIVVEGGSAEDRTKFYTGLYHAILGRGLASDVNGAYRQNNHATGQIPLDEAGEPEYHHYNTDAVWGAFWNLGTLWAMAYPEYLNDFVNTQLDIYKETGWLADGIATSKFVSGVGTNFMGQFIASAFNRGIRNYDTETAWSAVRNNELGWMNRPLGAGKADTKVFTEKGYVPYKYDDEHYSSTSAVSSRFSASHTLEYSFSAYAAAQMAKALGKTEDYEKLMELSGGWENLFDEDSGFIRPRGLDGEFISDFDPSEPWRGFQEGNAYQYTFYVPQDPESLIAKIGADSFTDRLNALFERAEEQQFSGGDTVDAFSGVGGVYNHGNQPSLHISWLFNYAGKPWLTQKWVRRISDNFYGTGPVHGYGYGQDEDQGQLGAWYLLAGMGLFDVAGGSDKDPMLQLSAPLFDKITIRLNQDYYSGETFRITADGDASEDHYIRSVTLNGKPLNTFQFPWRTFTQGGELEIKRSHEPVESWGTE